MNRKAKILYVEDDINLGFVTQDNLEIHGFDVVLCKNGLDAQLEFQNGNFDLCVLDVMLPKIDGFTLAKEIRKTNKEIPIIFLTAKSLKEDKIAGLRLGADDYIVKPFSIEELILKIEIFLKRSKVKNPKEDINHFNINNISFDFKQQEIKVNAQIFKLTRRESELLKFLITYKNTVLEREYILSEIWGDDDYFLGRSLDVIISRLRQHLKVDPSLKIENIHGVGFIFKA